MSHDSKVITENGNGVLTGRAVRDEASFRARVTFVPDGFPHHPQVHDSAETFATEAEALTHAEAWASVLYPERGRLMAAGGGDTLGNG